MKIMKHMKRQIFNTMPPSPPPPPPRYINKGIAVAWLYRLAARFLKVLRSFPRWRATMMRRSLRLLVLCLALGATQANAQAADTSVNIVLGNGDYTFLPTDFPGFTGSAALYIDSLPERGTLFFEFNGVPDSLVGKTGRDNLDAQSFFPSDFLSASSHRLKYTPPTGVISSATVASFDFTIEASGVVTTATMTINLVGAFVDVDFGGGAYTFLPTDFPGFTGSAVLYIDSLPERGTLFFEFNGVPDSLVGKTGRDNLDAQSFFPSDFLSASSHRLKYTPPTDVISVTTTSFDFSIEASSVVTTATMTINLVGASTQMAASGAPTVDAAMGTAYNTNVPLTASITGVTERNGINVSTLVWKWQQADAPASGAPATSAYSDIAGATATGVTSSDFTPLAAQAGKYLRVCASFMDQFSTPASGERCSAGSLVANAPFFGDASVDDQFWVLGTALNLVLPEATGGNGAITYSLTPLTLPTGISFTASSRILSGTPTAAKVAATYTYTATDTDGDTATLTFRIETGADAAPAFAANAANAAIAEQTWLTGTAITDLTLPAATGGNGALTYALTPELPEGLSLDPATRTISGIPTAAPQSNYTWTVADADNNTASGDTASLTFSVISNLRLRLRLFLEGSLR